LPFVVAGFFTSGFFTSLAGGGVTAGFNGGLASAIYYKYL
jgi:hypothetical protein